MKINFYTAAFPFGKGETVIESEIPVICDLADHMNIIPYHATDKNSLRTIPDGSTILDHEDVEPAKLKFRDYLIIVRIMVVEFFLTSKKIFFLKKLSFG